MFFSMLFIAMHLLAQQITASTAPSPAESTLIATVLGDEIRLDDLTGPDDDCCRLMAGAIFGALIDDFRSRNTFDIAEWELDEFQLFSSPKSRRSELNAHRDIAREFVTRWKTYQLLVETYGGEIHFQQFDPLEPVGAIRSFLEEEQRLGRFTIFTAHDECRFWEFYRARFPYKLKDPVEAYRKPWWSYSKDEIEKLQTEE